MSLHEIRPVACVGSAIVDCIITGFDPQPVSASGYAARNVELQPGGEAVNQSVALAKLGMKPRTVCYLGNDAASALLRQTLSDVQADLSFVTHTDTVSAPVAVMFVDENGDRKSVTRRTYYNFHPETDLHWMDGCSAISLCSLFRAPFTDPEAVFRIVSEAKARGLLVYADTKLPIAEELRLHGLRDALPFIDVIFPNEKEAAFYSGREDPAEAAEVFLSYGVKNVIVKLGERGCLFRSASEMIRIPGLSVDAVDATGAGDNFIAGFVTFQAEGHSVEESLRFANACGAISTTLVGSSSALKDRTQVLAFLEQHSAGLL